MINKDKIRAKVKKAIKKLPSTALVKRAIVNDFGELTDLLEDICTLEGLYHEGNGISVALEDKGRVKSDRGNYFLVVCDEITKKLNEGDYLFIDNRKYQILDLNNINKLDIYLDMRLREINGDII